MKRTRLESVDEEDIVTASSSIPAPSNERIKCPYLDTVNRNVIDFDQEKLCSVTLTNMNVYACLVCGKFFQGRGKLTPAYTHSVEHAHFVYMNLQNGRCWCLPDMYEIIDVSLSDVQRNLSPTFTSTDIRALNSNTSLSRDINGVAYLPGFMALNNLSCTDYINVVLTMLANVTPFRNFWLDTDNYRNSQSHLVQVFGLTVRKIWSNGNFKSAISPQELIQQISTLSNKHFNIGRRMDCVELLNWLLSSLNAGLAQRGVAMAMAESQQGNRQAKGAKRRTTHVSAFSAISDPFQGKVEVFSMTKRLVSSLDATTALETLRKAKSDAKDDVVAQDGLVTDGDMWESSTTRAQFTLLSVDIPPCPLFRDSKGGLIVPQIPLFELLSKFDGETWTDTMSQSAHVRKQYKIKELPRYLVIHMSRFTKNNFSMEKNPTIVTFPVRNLEMKHYLNISDNEKVAFEASAIPNVSDIEAMGRDEILAVIERLGNPHHLEQLQRLDSSDLTAQKHIAFEVVERARLKTSTKYDLLASISHDMSPGARSLTSVKLGDVSSNSSGLNDSKTNATMAGGDLASGGSRNSSSSSAQPSANVLGQGSFKIHLNSRATGQWYEINDLRVVETSPQLIGVSEAYVLVYEKK